MSFKCFWIPFHSVQCVSEVRTLSVHMIIYLVQFSAINSGGWQIYTYIFAVKMAMKVLSFSSVSMTFYKKEAGCKFHLQEQAILVLSSLEIFHFFFFFFFLLPHLLKAFLTNCTLLRSSLCIIILAVWTTLKNTQICTKSKT